MKQTIGMLNQKIKENNTRICLCSKITSMHRTCCFSRWEDVMNAGCLKGVYKVNQALLEIDNVGH